MASAAIGAGLARTTVRGRGAVTPFPGPKIELRVLNGGYNAHVAAEEFRSSVCILSDLFQAMVYSFVSKCIFIGIFEPLPNRLKQLMDLISPLIEVAWFAPGNDRFT